MCCHENNASAGRANNTLLLIVWCFTTSISISIIIVSATWPAYVDIQESTCLVSVLSYYCVVTHSGVQEAGEADTASMDEEQAAQEEVERLDSGTTLHMSHGSASLLLVYITVYGIRGSGSACSCEFKQLDCCCQPLPLSLLLSGGTNHFWQQ